MKLAALATHPIQYHSPLFRELAKEADLRVYFAELPDAYRQGSGFGRAFQWDVPLVEGYQWEVYGGRTCAPGAVRHTRTLRNLRRAFAHWKPDVVLLTGWQDTSQWIAALVAVFSRRPILFRGENNLLVRRPLWKLCLHRLFLSTCRYLLYIGEENKRYYERLGFCSAKMRFCPYFSDGERIAKSAETLLSKRNEIRTRWRIPPGAPCFLFCGKLTKKKRCADFVRAVKRVPGAHGLIVGDGELRDELEALAGPVSFAGFLNQSEIAQGYAAADVLVLPSDATETWGLVVNEAMACGLPCIVSDKVGCRRDLVIEGRSGLSFTCGDIADLARCLQFMAEDPARRKEMGVAARLRLESEYTVHSATKAILNAARDAVEKRSSPGGFIP